MTNYQRFQPSEGPDEEGVCWWTSMRYNDQQIVRTQFAAGEPTSYPGVRQSGQYLLCQERDDGPIHLFDNQMWSVKNAYTYCTTGFGTMPDQPAPQDQSLAAVMMRTHGGGQHGQDGQNGGQRDQQQDGQAQQDQTQENWKELEEFPVFSQENWKELEERQKGQKRRQKR